MVLTQVELWYVTLLCLHFATAINVLYLWLAFLIIQGNYKKSNAKESNLKKLKMEILLIMINVIHYFSLSFKQKTLLF